MEIQEKKSLKEYSTYKIGGKADYFCVIKQKNDIAEAIDFAKRNRFHFVHRHVSVNTLNAYKSM